MIQHFKKYFYIGIIFISFALYKDSLAQDLLSINNESIVYWLTRQILFKDSYEEEAKILKKNNVSRFHMNYDNSHDYYQNSGTINKNGYITGRFYYDTTQIPEQEIIAKLDSKNRPSYIFQYRADGERFMHYFSYDEDNNIKIIADLSDSSYYQVIQVFYSSNKEKPLLNKILMTRSEEISKYVNFRYNDEGKLISVYEEGKPDLYRIKYEPDKVIITKVDGVSTIEFKNGVISGYNYFNPETNYKYKSIITFNSKGLKETSTNIYDDGTTYKMYYIYEYYDK